MLNAAAVFSGTRFSDLGAGLAEITAILRELGGPLAEAQATLLDARQDYIQGRVSFEEVEDATRACMLLYRQTGSEGRYWTEQGFLVNAALLDGRLEEAVRMDLERIEAYERMGSLTVLANALGDLAINQAIVEYRASQDNQMQISRKVTEQVKLAWQSLITARERLELLENAVNIASEVFESRKKLREAGKETVINVLDAENEVNNAQINFTGASYDERVAAFQLLLAMGRLNAATLGLPVQ